MMLKCTVLQIAGESDAHIQTHILMHSHLHQFLASQLYLCVCLFVIRISILPFQCLHATQVGLQQLKPIIKYNDNHTKITIG